MYQHYPHSIIGYNISWMAFNLSLAFLPLLFASLFFRFNNKLLKVIFFIAWLAYIPNSAYVITDMLHLIDQWGSIASTERLLVISQYLVFEFFGLTAFVFALYPFEKLIKRSGWKRSASDIIILLNFFIGFGMVLGRVDRVNSWQIITAPQEVITAVLHVFSSFDLMLLALLFGLFNNFLYFLFRKPVGAFYKNILP